MYRLTSTNGWFNGMRFAGLVEALRKQRKATELGCIVDVMRDEDRRTAVCVKGSPLAIPIVNKRICYDR